MMSGEERKIQYLKVRLMLAFGTYFIFWSLLMLLK